MELIKQILEKWDLVALFVALNLAFGGLAQLLRWISTKTAVTWDDELAKKFSSVAGFTAKVVDWVHGNAQHKDPEVRTEIQTPSK